MRRFFIAKRWVKNRPGALALVSGLCLSLFVSGCTPAGPRSLLEGKKLIEKGRYRQALERLTNAVALMPTNAQALNYLGLACQYAGRPAEAEAAYLRALRLNQDLTEAHYNLGCLWLEQNKPDQARSELTAFTLRRGNAIEGFLKLGAALLASHDASALSAAEKTFQEALHLEPQNPEALNGLGMLRYHQRRYEDAQQLFLGALKQRPGFAPAILNLAILAQVRFQDYPTALHRYRQYVALKPLPANAEAVLVISKELEERLKPAPPPVATTSSVPPPVSTPVSQKSNSGSHAETRAPTQTVAAPSPLKTLPGGGTSTTTPSSNPPSSPPTNSRFPYKPVSTPTSGNRADADRLFRQGREAQDAHRLADAIAAYRSATQLDPSYFEAYYNLGLTATEAGNLELALSAYESALGLVPDSANARYNFALLLKQAGYTTDAANELEKLLAKHPNDTRGHLALANLSAQQLHDDARARQHYMKVLETDPHNSQADDIRRWIADHPQ